MYLLHLMEGISVALLFALLNRFWGMGVTKGSWLDKNHHNLSAFLAFLVGLLLAKLGGDSFWCFLLPLGWLVGRSIGFHTFGGSLNPNTATEVTGSFLRFLMPMPFVVLATCGLYGFGAAVIAWIPCACIAMAFSQTAFSYAYAQALRMNPRPTWDYNVAVELAHGAVYGAVSAVLVLNHHI